MAAQTLSQVPWADGTTVGVYPAVSVPAGSDAPSGTAVASAVVAGGAVSFIGLQSQVRYYAYAGGRGVRFLIPVTSASGDRARIEALEAEIDMDAVDSRLDTFATEVSFGEVGTVGNANDIGQAGVYAPTSVPTAAGLDFSLVADREYLGRAFFPRKMVIGRVAFFVRVAASVDDPVFVGLRDADGALIASSVSTTGKLNSTGVKTVDFTAAVAVEAGESYYVCILCPTIGGTAAQVRGTGGGSGTSYGLFGLTAGTAEATQRSTAGGTLPAGAPTFAETAANVPVMAAVDLSGRPFRARWKNNAKAPFTNFHGLSEGAQVSYSSTVQRVPGRNTVRHLVRSGDVMGGTSPNGERSEFVSGPVSEKAGDEFWYALSVYFDPAWTDVDAVAGSKWAIFTQWHCGFATVSPPVALTADSGEIKVNITSGELSVSGTTTSHVEVRELVPTLELGVWHDFLVRAYWHITAGRLAIYHRISDELKFKQVLNLRDIPTLQKANGAADSAAANADIKQGLYRSATAHDNVLHHAGLWRGRMVTDVLGLFGDPVLLG